MHRWDMSPREAIKLQQRLRTKLLRQWDGRAVTTVGGVDVSVKGEVTRAAIVVLRYPDLTGLEAQTAELPVPMPYIPGLLTFREAPAILAVWDKLQLRPDVVMFDGQGIAHQRGIGIAAHLGLWLQRPTIGVAKSWLTGRFDDPAPEKGAHTPLVHAETGDVIGAVVRTRDRVKPVWVSPGHLIDVPTSVRLVLACATKYRLPMTTHWAHRVAGGADLSTG